MHFDQFDSYRQTLDAAQSFVIEVKLADGSTEKSSAMPIGTHKAVASEIADCIEAQSEFTMWNRHSNAIVVMPYHQIVAIKLLLAE